MTNQTSICCILIVTSTQLLKLFAYPENHVEIAFVILLLSRKKFHKQICVLSSSMKFGPEAFLRRLNADELVQYFFGTSSKNLHQICSVMHMDTPGENNVIVTVPFT